MGFSSNKLRRKKPKEKKNQKKKEPKEKKNQKWDLLPLRTTTK